MTVNAAVWILYDGRAMGGNGPGDAVALVVCESDLEARSYAGDYGDMACYAYTPEERWAWDWSVESGFSDANDCEHYDEEKG